MSLIIIAAILGLAKLATILLRNRDLKAERKLGKSYHNQKHSFAACDVDTSRCDYCGRPFSDVIHQVR